MYYQGKTANKGNELSNRLTIEGYALMILKWLSKDHCIVPKKRVKDYYKGHQRQLSMPSNDPRDAYEQKDSKSQILALENIFGKEIFKEK